jgi:hypothetical protein
MAQAIPINRLQLNSIQTIPDILFGNIYPTDWKITPLNIPFMMLYQ